MEPQPAPKASNTPQSSRTGPRVTVEPIPVRLPDPWEAAPPNDQPSIIVLLQQVQEEKGYLPRSDVVRCAREAGISVARAYGVASFYNFFKLTPPGKHTIRICQGTACHVQGAQGLLDWLQSELGIEAGETTRDGLFTLQTVACLGACSMSPALIIDDEVFGQVTTRQIRRILGRYRRKS